MQEHARLGKENQSQRVSAISDLAHQHHLHHQEAGGTLFPAARKQG